MYSVFLDITGERIIYGESLHIEVIEVLTPENVLHNFYKDLTNVEMIHKVKELKNLYCDFDVIDVCSTMKH